MLSQPLTAVKVSVKVPVELYPSKDVPAQMVCATEVVFWGNIVKCNVRMLSQVFEPVYLSVNVPVALCPAYD